MIRSFVQENAFSADYLANVKSGEFKTKHYAILGGLLLTALLGSLIYTSRIEPLPTRTPDGSRAFTRAELSSFAGTFQYWDYWCYLAMAEKPFADLELVRTHPYCWRLLTPTLVHLIPVEKETGFLLFTYASLLLAAFCLRRYLGLFFDPAMSLWGVAIFLVLGSTFIDRVVFFMDSEPFTLALFVLGLYLIETRKRVPLLLLVWVGVLQRELLLSLGLIHLIREAGRSPMALREKGLTAVFYIVIPFLIYKMPSLLMRYYDVYDVHNILESNYEFTLKTLESLNPAFYPGYFIWMLISPWGFPGIFLISFGWRQALRYFRERLHDVCALVLLYCLIPLGPQDTARYICYAAPVVIAAYLYAVRTVFIRPVFRHAVLAVTVLIQFLWTAKIAIEELRFGFTRLPVLLGIWGVVVLGCWIVHDRQKRAMI